MSILIVGVKPLLLATLIAVVSCGPRCRDSTKGFPSNGLGLNRCEWEKVHGVPEHKDSMYYRYEGQRFFVHYLDGRSPELVADLIQQYPESAQVSVQAARAESKQLLPTDASFVRTYESNGQTVDLYYSDALKDSFSDEYFWRGGDPGNFIVLYKVDHNANVDSFVVTTGNNP